MKALSLRIALVLLTTSGSVSATPLAAPPHYTVTDIGVDLRTSESGPAGINDSGDIAGTVDASVTSSEHRAFRYHRGKITLLSDRDLRAAAINNRGEVACFSRFTGFLWDTHRMRELTPHSGGFGGFAGPGDLSVTGLNNKGQVIGSMFGLDGVFTSFLWQNGKLVGGFPQRNDRLTPFPFVRFEPRAINDRGQIAGFTHGGMLGGRTAHAILWDHGTVHEAADETAIFPYALNNNGLTAGTMYVGTKTHAFTWDGDSAVRDLGTVGGDRSEASGINDRGQIVGTADIHYEEVSGPNSTSWGGGRAILWQDGQAYNLNDLIPKDPGWILEKAIAINNRGQIVGTGRRSRDGRVSEGGLRIFLLTPH